MKSNQNVLQQQQDRDWQSRKESGIGTDRGWVGMGMKTNILCRKVVSALTHHITITIRMSSPHGIQMLYKSTICFAFTPFPYYERIKCRFAIANKYKQKVANRNSIWFHRRIEPSRTTSRGNSNRSNYHYEVLCCCVYRYDDKSADNIHYEYMVSHRTEKWKTKIKTNPLELSWIGCELAVSKQSSSFVDVVVVLSSSLASIESQ